MSSVDWPSCTQYQTMTPTCGVLTPLINFVFVMENVENLNFVNCVYTLTLASGLKKYTVFCKGFLRCSSIFNVFPRFPH
jgi:hypothetical protein